MWERHWGLARDPFEAGGPAFAETPGHAEAVARLVHTIEAGGRSARLIAGAGLGKLTVLARAIEATRSPSRRFARSVEPLDGAELFAGLAAGLGARVAPGSSRAAAWRALVDAARVCRWQGVRVVLAVDGCQSLASGADAADLGRLDHLDPDPAARLTVVRVGRPAGPAESAGPDWPDWGLAIRLGPLTRSEAAGYLGAKLGAAGRDEPAFTPRALTRLHALAGGVPRGLDRLAGLALMAGALRGLEVVPPDLVDAAAREFPALDAA